MTHDLTGLDPTRPDPTRSCCWTSWKANT